MAKMTPADGTSPRAPLRGRPSKEEATRLRIRIQAAALKEFRLRGYAGTSIDGVARSAAVSRTTIYALYTDKETLFSDLIRATVRGAPLARHVAFDDRAPAVILREALVVLNHAYYRDADFEVIRLCIAEADRFPDLFENVFRVLAATLVELIAYFERLRSERRMVVDDCSNAALLFNMLALGSLKPFFIHKSRLGEAERHGHIDLALQLFMRGCFTGADAMTGQAPAG